MNQKIELLGPDIELLVPGIELLAPGGDIDAIKAAIAAQADAIYCGLEQFNARNRATNIEFEILSRVINLAHKNSCKVFLTLNILIVESEIPTLISLLNKLVNTKIDGIIVQDLGVFYLLSKYFKGLKIHASTQLNTHNRGQIDFLKTLAATRMNLSRELNIDEIKSLSIHGKKNKISTEIFVQGSYCISFSGICYLSSVSGGRSGNRGRCSQPCRDKYLTTHKGKNFPLNLKDNSAYFDLKEIYDAGVDSIKIEGRMKNFDYVFTVVNCWKKQIINFFNHNKLNSNNSDLYKVFNRDFSDGYLKGNINKNMFIDNPRDYSIKRFSNINNNSKDKKLLQDKTTYYREKTQIIDNVKNKISRLSIEKTPLTMVISGKIDTPLKISIKTFDSSFTALSKKNLTKTNLAKRKGGNTTGYLNYEFLLERFKALNNLEYYIDHMELVDLQNDLFIPFSELTYIKKEILFFLNGSKDVIDPIEVPFLKKNQNVRKIKPELSILISSKKDLHLCDNTMADIFFQLPNGFKEVFSEYRDLFSKNRKIIPWFPSVLIGENYAAALNFLEQVQPELIITNNTGIAHEAYKKSIRWIAGPYLNIVNSFSLLCLKENFNCYGSFISNEISKNQIKRVLKPENFKLYYSIYHPILLLSSRQCLLHQVIGCEKAQVDNDCIQHCKKSSSITNLDKITLFIKKTKGNYHCIYSNYNFLNTDIVTDLPDMFSHFFIDLRDVKTQTKTKTGMAKSGIINLFEDLLNENLDAAKELKQIIYPTTNGQYIKGI